jgi:cytoplasmic iron level regulating protein YaaA (DUF328/UPF0246 family)
MIVYLACAKIMTGSCPSALSYTTEPHFQLEANENAVRLADYNPNDIEGMLKVNQTIAKEVWQRYQNFFNKDVLRQPAAFAYDGMVFQKLAPETFSTDELYYANNHLLIASFLYGLLRPLDMIMRYRLEGDVVLSHHDGKSMFDYWKPILTDYFIEQIKKDDGILVNLASDEMKLLVDWKRVRREVQVITPEFKVMKGGKLKTIVIYTKMCRGAMTRFILKNHISNPKDLLTFEYEGFKYIGTEKDNLMFVC